MTEKRPFHIILASHGRLARGMKSAVEMICGPEAKIEAYDLEEYQSPDVIFETLSQRIKPFPDEDFYIISDLLGGSVNIRLFPLVVNKNVVLISGMTLSMILCLLLDPKCSTLEESAKEAVFKSSQTTYVMTWKSLDEEDNNENNTNCEIF